MNHAPLQGGILGRRYNRTLHGRSVYRKKDVPGHNVIVGYSRPGVGDALDIFVPAGTPVFAMHAGRISRIADRGGRLSCLYVAAKGILTVYAHINIKPAVQLGSQVQAGQVIGYVDRKLRDPHLHLEVWIDGKALTARTAGELAGRIAMLKSTW
jgi:murein DD-endopeptidase MepM/ murein hydrolase activator NlpD